MDCQGLLHTCRGCGIRPPDRLNPCSNCGADRKCGKQAVKGYKFCEVHGGPNPSKGFYGMGAPIVTGSGSQFPLTRLAAKRNEMMKNGQILSNRDSINVLDRRMSELLDRIDTNQAPNRLLNLSKLWQTLRDCEENGMKVEAELYKKKIDEEFEKAYHDYKSWEQMFSVLDLRRKMVESEVKIAKDIQAMLTAEDAYELVADIFGVIIQAVNKFELDPKVLKYIQHELTRIVGDGSVVEVERNGGEVIDTE